MCMCVCVCVYMCDFCVVLCMKRRCDHLTFCIKRLIQWDR